MASSTPGSPPAGFNAPLPQQPEDEKNPVTVYVSSEEAVNKNKGRKYSILRRLLAFIFGWLITAAFVVLPGSLNNLEQSHPQKVEGVLRSVQNVPLYVPFLPFLIFHFTSPLPQKPFLFNRCC